MCVERIIRKDAGGEHCPLSLTHDKNATRMGLFYKKGKQYGTGIEIL